MSNNLPIITAKDKLDSIFETEQTISEQISRLKRRKVILIIIAVICFVCSAMLSAFFWYPGIVAVIFCIRSAVTLKKLKDQFFEVQRQANQQANKLKELEIESSLSEYKNSISHITTELLKTTNTLQYVHAFCDFYKEMGVINATKLLSSTSDTVNDLEKIELDLREKINGLERTRERH